jgi:hypothetical protein
MIARNTSMMPADERNCARMTQLADDTTAPCTSFRTATYDNAVGVRRAITRSRSRDGLVDAYAEVQFKMVATNDWYPYASAAVIAALEQAHIEPALCWIGNVILADGRRMERGPVVAIWERDLQAFRRAVKPADRVAIMVESGVAPELDLAALKAAVMRLD